VLSQDLGRLFRQILWSACRGSHDSTVSRAECGHSERQGSQGIPSLVLAMHSSDGGNGADRHLQLASSIHTPRKSSI